MYARLHPCPCTYLPSAYSTIKRWVPTLNVLLINANTTKIFLAAPFPLLLLRAIGRYGNDSNNCHGPGPITILLSLIVSVFLFYLLSSNTKHHNLFFFVWSLATWYIYNASLGTRVLQQLEGQRYEGILNVQITKTLRRRHWIVCLARIR
jgi:hypothetical protein